MRVARAWACVVLTLAAGAPLGAQAPARSLVDEWRLAELPVPARDAWRRYLAASRRAGARDRAVMSAELQRIGRARMSRAGFAAAPFTVAAARSGFAVDAVLSFQTPSGGWSKHVDMTARPREPGQSWFSESDDWQWIGTIDQGATTTQIRFLLAADSAGVRASAREGARRGVEYLLAAQMPGGCWPQVYPLMGGYHDAVAFAGDADAAVLALLGDVASSRLPLTLRRRAMEARRRGLDCVVSLQWRSAGLPTGWGLFHDPITGAPVAGRSYEPASLAPLETAALLGELLRVPDPTAAQQLAAHGAAAWLRREGLPNLRYAAFTLRSDSATGALLWPRLVSLGEEGPVFSNRDGVVRREWNELTDRRTGYEWFGSAPEAVLERYLAWSDVYPASGALAMAKVPTDSVARLPGRSVESDTTPLVTDARLERLQPAPRRAWELYRDRSRAAARVDREAMRAELARYGLTGMRRPAWSHDFDVTDRMTDAWFATDTARRIAESILSFQTPGGGWSKHVDFERGVRLPGESFNGESAAWRFIATIDNGSTTEEMRFLARRDAVSPDGRYRAAFLRGVAYLLSSRMAVGCFPQVFPLQGGYHDAATFNDDAIVNVAQLLKEVRTGAYPFVPNEVRIAAGDASDGAVGCMLNAQVVVNGVPTIWAQQHDPLTLLPTAGRSYELAALGPDESAHIAQFLLHEDNHAAGVVRAVHAAADWFKANRIDTLSYSHYQLTRQQGGGPLWGRMVEVETGRPIFANRDGVTLYDFDRLTDRRTGYRWFTAAPAEFLREYEPWSVLHPRPDAPRVPHTSPQP